MATEDKGNTVRVLRGARKSEADTRADGVTF